MAILVIAQTPTTNVFVRVSVLTTGMTVQLVTGSGADYKSRTFTGAGISNFDPLKGVDLNSPLTEAPEPGASPGTLGKITSITGKIDCGNQKPPTSTLTLSGDTPQGTLSGPLNPVSVACYPTNVLIIGLISAGSTPMLIDMNIASGLVTFFTSPKVGGQSQYAAPAGSATYTPPTAHVDGSAVEQVPAGTTARSVHIVGDVNCTP